LPFHTFVTQQDANWRILAPHSLFDAALLPITEGGNIELKRKSA
jgi:hypothetical protein